MRRPDGDLEVRCLTNDAGHVWIRYYDRLPPAVRRRLAESPFNICAACLEGEAQQRGEGKPSVATYLATIRDVERKLKDHD